MNTQYDILQAGWKAVRPKVREAVDHLGPRSRRWAGAVAHWAGTVFGKESAPKERLKGLVLGTVVVGVAMAVMLAAYSILLIPFTPSIGTLQKSRVEQPSVVLSADGEIIARYQRVNREWVPLDEISDHVVEALVATEDHRFYSHPGIDPVRLVGAVLQTLQGDRQGASTITQQLARNMFPDRIGRSISLTRKLKEMITAFKIELAYTKEEILEAYLNTVPFYFGAYGIEMAGRTYFGKSADELDVLEAATLVGMLKGTYYYNPVRNPDRALSRRNVALSQMVKRGYLEEARYEEMREGPIQLQFERQEDEESKAPHFTEHLRRWLIDWADRNEYNIYRDSLVIHTTLDLEMQELAERAVERQGQNLQSVADVEWGRADASLVSRNAAAYSGFRRNVRPFSHFWSSRPAVVRAFVRGTRSFRMGVESGVADSTMMDSLLAQPAFMDSLREEKTRLQAGLVALDPSNGYVRAWVGSRDFESDQYDHVARARRQPGSTFKPFVYARALQEGWRPDDTLIDQEVEIPLEGGEIWRPTNAGETVSGREISLREGLTYSMNTITAQLVDEVGAGDVARLARRMGVNRSDLRSVPSLALGTSEVSLLEMVSAYGTFAAEGVYHEPLMVTRIEDRRGRMLETFEPESRRALSEDVATTVVDIMRGVVDRGTGTRVRTTFGIEGDVAGKTGTTQYGADGWFILMHPQLVAGSWVGFNDPRVTFRSSYWGQGGNNALLVTGDFMRQVLRSGELEQPDASFGDPPEYDDEPTFLTRAFRWIGDRVSDVWNALFGEDEEEDEPARQGDTYIADRSDGGVQIDVDDESQSIADSLTRMERRSNRLDSLIERLPQRGGGGATPGSAPPETPAAPQTDEAGDESPSAESAPAEDGGEPAEGQGEEPPAAEDGPPQGEEADGEAEQDGAETPGNSGPAGGQPN